MKLHGQQGLIVAICGSKLYFIGKKKTTGEGTLWDKCCVHGMIPATINRREDVDCLFNKFKVGAYAGKVVFSGPKLFYTNYMDWRLNFTFMTCPDKSELPSHMWAASQPDNYKGLEACVALSLDPFTNTSSGYHDVACTHELFYICEVPMDASIRAYFAPFFTTTSIPESTVATTSTSVAAKPN